MGGLSRFLAQLAATLSRYPKWVLVVAFLITVVSIIGITRLSVDVRASAMLPAKLPALEAYRKQVAEFGRAEFLVVMIQAPKGVPLDRYSGFIGAYKNSLENLAMTKGEYLNLSPELLGRIGDYILSHGIYLVPPESLDKLQQALEPDNFSQKLKAPPLKGLSEQRERFDPLGLITLAEQHFLPSKNIRPHQSGKFYVTRDNQLAFFIFGSQVSAGQTEPTRQLLATAKRLEQQLLERFEEYSGGTFLAPTVTWTGLPVIFLQDYESLKDTILKGILLSLAGVTLLFILFFRSLRSLALAVFPLLLGITWTFGFAGFAFGSLNIATAGIGAILIGLGIDFPAYLLNAYYRRRRAGQSSAESLQKTWAQNGRSVCFGALSTSVAFFMLAVTELAAFRELGLLAGMGLLLTMLAVLTLLPVLLQLQSKDASSPRHLPDRVIEVPLRRPRIVLSLSLILLIGFSLFSGRIQIDMNYQETHAEGTEAMETRHMLAEALDNDLQPLMLIISGKNWAQALSRNEKLGDLLNQYQSDGKILHYDALTRWLPSRKRTQEIDRYLKTHEGLNPQVFRQQYREALPKGLKKDSDFALYRKGIQRALEARRPPRLESLKEAGLGILLERYARTEEYRTRLVNYVYLPRSESPGRVQAEFLESLSSEEPFQQGWATYISDQSILKEMAALIRSDVTKVAVAILGAVLLTLWLAFRSVPLALVGLIPMLLGVGAMLGSYALLKTYLNGVNLLFIPLFIGLAIDDAVHLINQVRVSGGDIAEALRRTGMPILFTSLTTIVGFASFGLSPFPILQQAGILIVIAMFWELIASLVFLPALLSLTGFAHRSSGSAKSAGSHP